jgi:hypothetical protein
MEPMVLYMVLPVKWATGCAEHQPSAVALCPGSGSIPDLTTENVTMLGCS